MEIRSEKVISNLLDLMNRANLNQRRLALKANIPPEYLNKIIKGKRGLGMSMATKLAKALGCTTDELFLQRPREKKATPTIGALLLALSEQQKEIDKIRANLLVAYAEMVTPDKKKVAEKFLSTLLDDSSRDEAKKRVELALRALEQQNALQGHRE